METSTWVWIIFWFICSILSFLCSFTFFRIEYADFKNHKKAYKGDFIVCLCLSVVGPISLVVIWFLGYTKHGIKIESLSRDYEGGLNETICNSK